MKTKLVILALLFQTIIFAHETGETLYIFATNGINIRTSPNVKSEIFTCLPYGTAIKYCKDSHSDTFENRKGKWIKIEHNLQFYYLFDGYLSPCPPPSLNEITIKSMDTYIKDCFGVKLKSAYNYEKAKDSNNNYMPLLRTRIIYESNLEAIYSKKEEGDFYHYNFQHINENYLINIIDVLYNSLNKVKKPISAYTKSINNAQNYKNLRIDISKTITIIYGKDHKTGINYLAINHLK